MKSSSEKFGKIFFITLAAIIATLILSIIIDLTLKYKKQEQNRQKESDKKEISKIKNSIKWIKFNITPEIPKEFNDPNTKLNISKIKNFFITFIIFTEDINSANEFKNLMEKANIFSNTDEKFSVQLQNTPERKNLLSIAFESDKKYKPEFKKIIKKLMNSKYNDEEQQKLFEEVFPKLITRQLTNKQLSEKESNKIQQFTEKEQYIKFDDFAEFLLICKKNPKEINQEINITDYAKIGERKSKSSSHDQE